MAYEPHEYPLPISDAGIPRLDRITTLTVPEWMNWLRARSEEVDVYTGQTLIGASDPFEIVRNTIIRIDDDNISSRFVDAALQLVAELSYQLTVSADPSHAGVERTSHLLADILELLSSLPERVVRFEKRFDRWSEQVYSLLTRILDSPKSETATPVLLQGAYAFLRAFSYPIPREDLLSLLRHPSTAADALLELLQTQDRHAEYFESFVDTCLTSNNHVLLDMVIESIASEFDENLARRLLLSFSGTNAEQWKRVNSLPAVIRILSYSETIKIYRSTKVLFYTDNRFLDGDRSNGSFPNEPTPYANDLLEAILTRAKEEISGELICRPSPAWETWDQQAEDVVDGVVALDPIFLSHKRSRLLSLVPYGYVDELCVVYIDRNPERSNRLRTTLQACENSDVTTIIASEYSAEDNIGCLGGTSATDELIHSTQQMGRALKPHSEVHLRTLLEFLLEKINQRILILDVGFFPILQGQFRAEKPGSVTLRDAALQKVALKYRRPVLAGVPFPKEDLYWGRKLRGAVDEVFYAKHHIDKQSDLSSKMLNVGIKPLTQDVLATLEPWINIDRMFYPASVVDGSLLPVELTPQIRVGEG